MKRATFALLLLPFLGAESCARASASPRAAGVPYRRTLMFADGISVRVGPALTALPPDQRYRFVSPDSLAMGVRADDESSTGEPRLAELRQAFSTVVGSSRWVESPDSAQFDVTIFTTARMKMRRHERPQLAANVIQCGELPTTQLQWCTDDPIDYTEQWTTEYATIHILRRRSDGALRLWRRAGIPTASDKSRVADALRGMLRASEDR